jgi:hypothetical protein
MNELRRAIVEKMQSFPMEVFAPSLEKLQAQLPSQPLFILGYGSCLSQTTQSSTSLPDFYVVVKDYASFYQNKKHTWMNRHIPPNIYNIHSQDDIIKYCIISLPHLAQEVSMEAKDVYHVGRFSKRLGWIWPQDTQTLEEYVDLFIQAKKTAALKTQATLTQPVDIPTMIQKILALSYVGDVRIEAGNKVEKIFLAEQAYYEKIYTLIMKELGMIGQDQKIHPTTDPSIKHWIGKSRIRARMRWIKNMCTVDSWIDYMLFKINRTQDMQIHLTDRQKKYWFITIWPVLWKLQRAKLIK